MANKDEKEIDLLEISGNIVNNVKVGFSKLFSSLLTLVKTTFITSIKLAGLFLDSWKFILIAAAIIVGATYYMYNSHDPYYNSDAYGISKITGSQEIIQIINSISIPNDNLNIALKNDLKLSPEVYNNVLSIKASWLIDENGDGIADIVDYDNNYVLDPEDSIANRMTDRFNVRLTLKNQSITDEVQIALKKYLLEHPYINDLNNSRLSRLNGKIKLFENQANVLDSLQYYEYFKSTDKNTIQSLKIGEFELIGQNEDKKDKRLYHEDIIQLKENVIENTSTIQFDADPITFVGNFTNTIERTNSMSFYARKMILTLLPLALLIFILLKRRKLESIFNIKRFLEN